MRRRAGCSSRQGRPLRRDLIARVESTTRRSLSESARQVERGGLQRLSRHSDGEQRRQKRNQLGMLRSIMGPDDRGIYG